MVLPRMNSFCVLCFLTVYTHLVLTLFLEKQLTGCYLNRPYSLTTSTLHFTSGSWTLRAILWLQEECQTRGHWNGIDLLQGSSDGAVVAAPACLSPMWPGLDSGPMSYVVVSCLALRVFLRVHHFTKTNISKLQFHQDGGPAWIQLRKLSSSNIAAYCLLLFVTLVFDLLSGRNLNLINCTIWTELWTRAELIKWTNIFLSRIPSRGLFHLYSAVKPCKASTVKANRLKKIYIE